MSIVFRARPAPLTKVPIRLRGSPSLADGGSRVSFWLVGMGEARCMYTMPASSASRVIEASSRRAWRSDWRFVDLKAASSKKR